MKTLRLFCVGARPPVWCTSAEQIYCRQMRHFRLSVSLLPADDKEKEAQRVLRHLPPSAWVVLLDVGGSAADSPGITAGLQRWLQQRAPVLVIAGADGAGEALRQRADETLSLSPLTLPHALARLVLVEQLFRADCVLRRHPYPR